MTPLQPIDAVLLDMDGTILNSIKAAERIWSAWAQRHGIDVETLLPRIHGVQSVETIRRLALPSLDPVREAAAITQAEIDDADGIEAIAGAGEFLAELPAACWAVVTSAPRALAMRRMQAAGLPAPALLVAAEDVPQGKPAPDCFELAARRLGTTADRCLVFEDSLAGITSAERAGATVLVVTATHDRPMPIRHESIRDYRDLILARSPDGSIAIRHALVPKGPSAGISFRLRAPAATRPSRA
ncbi:MAG: HAD-IA family hydrolase [Steroidobacteraceae bacterium]